MSSYEELLGWAYGLQKFGIKFGLSSTARLLKKLGNPHRSLKFAHIGGTNGKGSVAAVLSAALKNSGFRVGLYTSPHLVRFEERFKINDQIISQDRVKDLMMRVREAVDPAEPPTFFEFTTAMALTLFAEEHLDFAIVEVGMGGRLDATNLVEPCLTVLTNVSLEHQDYLGDTLLQIAEEKAGIIKKHTPLVSAARQSDVIDLFSKRCLELDSPFYLSGRDFQIEHNDRGLRYEGLGRILDGFENGLKGNHQEVNTGLALCSLEVLQDFGYSWDERAITNAIKAPHWPGRFQHVADDPITILDGAHNPQAAEALMQTVKSAFSGSRVVMVLGIMSDKDIPTLVATFLSGADEAILSRPSYIRAADPGLLVQSIHDSPVPFEVCVPLSLAIERAREKAGRDGVVIITGSLFTVGEAMEILGIEP